jgi:hypothetical protein
MIATWDGREIQFQRDQNEAMTLADVLKQLLDIWPQDTDIPRDLLVKEVPGDWVVPANWFLDPQLSWNEKVAALLPELSEVIGDAKTLKQQPIEREVIVARGSLNAELMKLRPNDNVNAICFLGGEAKGHSIAQDAREMLQRLGEVAGRPVVVEANLGPPEPFDILMDGAEKLRLETEIIDTNLCDQILRVVSEQTGMQLTRETRTIPTWGLVK